MDYAKSVAFSGAGVGWSAMGLLDGLTDLLVQPQGLGGAIFWAALWVVLLAVWIILLRRDLRRGRDYGYDSRAAHKIEFYNEQQFTKRGL